MEEALLRRKIEMKNLAVYCNWGVQNFVSRIPIWREEEIYRQMTELILKKGEEENRGRNNYFLVMNVLGIIDEQHVG